jgi:hypothetical protein
MGCFSHQAFFPSRINDGAVLIAAEDSNPIDYHERRIV